MQNIKTKKHSLNPFPMRVISIILFIFFVQFSISTSSIYSQNTKNPSDKKNPDIKPTETVIDKDKAKENEPKTPMGIDPFILGVTIQSLEKELKKIDNSFSGFTGKIEDHYYQKIPKLQGKKLDSPLVKLVDDRVYYIKAIEYMLIPSSTQDNEKSYTLYRPKRLIFQTQKINSNIKYIHIKFYDNVLYEIKIVFELGINEMNELVDQYHKNFGDKSDYNSTTETYLWKKDNFKISLNLRGNSFPRKIRILFTHLPRLEENWHYFNEAKTLIDKL